MSGQPDRQAPALNRRRIGEYVVTYLSDGFLDGSFAYLSGIEEEAAKAMLTRMRVLDEVATDRLAVAGMHFNMPGFITVERHGPGYAKVELPWLPAL